jgi:cysteinyl-tRNA synthetase
LRDVPENDATIHGPVAMEFNTVMDDDFNTPKAIALLHDLAHRINRLDKNSAEAQALAVALRHFGGVLGLLQESPEEYLQSQAGHAASVLSNTEIEALIARRNQARKNRDYNEADRVRDQLQKQGIVLEDTATGTVWRRV